MAYSTITKSTTNFTPKLFSGTGSSNAITGVGFKPDITWIRNRTTSEINILTDAVRGVTKTLSPSNGAIQTPVAEDLKSFDTDGFTVGTNNRVNKSGDSIISWNWKAGNLANATTTSNTDGSITSGVSVNSTGKFSIVKWQGTGSAATIGHGLATAPKWIITKAYSGSTANWGVYHHAFSTSPQNVGMVLNEAEDFDTNSSYWNNTAPTSTVFSVNSNNATNQADQPMIAYCWAEVQGFSRFGFYKGNGQTNGSFQYLGFAPSFLMIKKNANSTHWVMFDNQRIGYNTTQGVQNVLRANTDVNEATAGGDAGGFGGIDFLSNGFKCKMGDANINTADGDYYYMAFGQTIVGSNNQPTIAR
tara:strand:+ start:1990 stop:3069 length:1080 start_codon:yes stop_codon:yes gene_type:complete